MCLWLLTACLGLLPANPSPAIIVVSGVPAPIITPTTTTAATTTTTAATTTTTAATTTTTAATTTTMTTTTTARPPTTAPPPPATTATMTTAMTMPPPTPPPTTTTTAAATTAGPPPTSTASSTSIGVVRLPLIICTNPESVCQFNPNENVAGPLPIDPRLGTTPGLSAALNGPPITGYSAQVPSYDTAVKFPRQRRSIKFHKEPMNVMDFLGSIQRSEDVHKIFKRQSCSCVPSGTCIRATSGAGMIDIRIVTPVSTQCASGQEYCCGNTTTATTAVGCGTLQTVPATAITPAAGQASFGEFPWQAIILTKQNDYIAGGVLVDQLNVLTVTHRLMPYVVSGTAPNVKVRLGEWDAAGTYEPIPYQEYTVAKVFSHPSFIANTLQYDITVLRLASAVPFTPSPGAVTSINRACLPPSSTSTYSGQRCWVSGWGKNMFGVQGQYQQILKKVDVPIVAPATCQTQLQTARLGSSYVLDTTSFVCAGGEAAKDSCTGDGGSGLVCQVSGRWVVVGLVAWGLGCAAANVSAVYVNIAGMLPWIQQQIATA